VTANRRLGPTGQSICSDIQLVRDLQDGEAFGYASRGGKKAMLALYIMQELVSDELWRLALVRHPQVMSAGQLRFPVAKVMRPREFCRLL
jgi:hypothetical protein